MVMKNFIILLLMSLFALNGSADVINDTKKVSIRAILPANEDIPQEAASQLQDKLDKIVSFNGNGLTNNGLTNRFVFTSKVNVVEKNIVATSPARISIKLNISFYIGDIIDNKVYESAQIDVIGIGTNENKAYIKAINQIPVTNKALKTCIESGKLKIAEYYSSNCNSVLIEADRLAKQGQYEAAIAELVSVPDICEECYRTTREKAVEINYDYMDIQGKKLIKEANSVWMVRQDYDCAEKALNILSKVNPLARCSQQADDLMESMNKKLRDDEAKEEAKQEEIEKRNWDFKVKVYNDRMEQYRIEEANKTALMGKLIDAAENVGCAFGNSQPKIISNTNYVKGW